MSEMLSRTKLLIGDMAIKKLEGSCVAVFGLGGVGSYAVEALVRAGVGKIILVDNDVVSESNLNRQLYALNSTVGKLKTEVAKDRINDINRSVAIITYPLFYNEETKSQVELWGVDYIVDCIDSVKSKVLLAMVAKELNVPIISAFGTGNKLSNTSFVVGDVYSTSVCPLAKVMRRELKKAGIEKMKVVYSTEEPIANVTDKVIPSISFVPSVAGLILAGEVVKDLIK